MGSIGSRHYTILKYKFPDSSFWLCDPVKGFKVYKEVCDQEFDLCVICVPSAFHVEIAKDFINTKSFFIEKPLDSNISKIEENLDFFKNKKTMIGCNFWFSKHTEELKRFLPICLFANIKAHTFLPLWRENYKELYSSRKDLGGGVLGDYSHEIHLVYQILGPPKNVRVIKRKLTDFTVDTEDYALITFEYEDKIVNIEVSYLCQDKHRVSEVVLPNGSRKIIDFSGGKQLPYQQTVEDTNETYKRQWDYFFQTGKPINSYDDAYNLLKIIDNAF